MKRLTEYLRGNKYFVFFLSLALCHPAMAQTVRSIDASDYPTLQAAVDALPLSGGVINIPPGEYELTTPLLVTTENTRLQGSGGATHLINTNQHGEPAIIVRSGKGDQLRVELSNFRISGNSKSGDGIYMEKVQESLITEMSIGHNGGHGINMLNCYENPRIVNNNITYNAKAGVNIDGGHDIIVSANEFEENQDALRIKDGFNLTMTGNNIDDHLRHGIVVENTYGSIISSNMIEECKGTAIILKSSESDPKRFSYGITISANVIAHHLGGGVELRGAWGCAISANTFTLVHKNSILLSEGTGGITITGNNFSNSRGKLASPKKENPFTWDVGTGIQLQGASDVIISGNYFGRLSTEAVKADEASNGILVTGNVISDLLNNVEIKLESTNNNLVKDNLIKKEEP